MAPTNTGTKLGNTAEKPVPFMPRDFCALMINADLALEHGISCNVMASMKLSV